MRLWRPSGVCRGGVSVSVPDAAIGSSLPDVLGDRSIEGAVGNLAVWIDNLNWRVERLLALSDSVWVGAP